MVEGKTKMVMRKEKRTSFFPLSSPFSTLFRHISFRRGEGELKSYLLRSYAIKHKNPKSAYEQSECAAKADSRNTKQIRFYAA